MRITKRYCDHCGKEILDNTHQTAEINLFNYRSVTKRAKNLDLCPDCAATLYDFMYPNDDNNDLFWLRNAAMLEETREKQGL